MKFSATALAAALLLLSAAVAYPQNPPQPHTTADLVNAHYGVPNAIVDHVVVSCGTTPVQLTLDNSSRFADVFANLGTTSCTLAHSDLVSTTLGFPLEIDGVISEEWRDDMTLPTYSMWCVCGAAAQSIDVTELLLP